jgi:hypothetical protein
MGCKHGGKGPGKILAQSNRASNIWAGNGGDIEYFIKMERTLWLKEKRRLAEERKAKFPSVHIEKLGLQELQHHEAKEIVITIWSFKRNRSQGMEASRFARTLQNTHPDETPRDIPTIARRCFIAIKSLNCQAGTALNRD